MIPETTVTTMARCSGHAGTWGVKKEFHKTAIKIGRPVFKQMAAAEPDYIASDCRLAGHHIQQRNFTIGQCPCPTHSQTRPPADEDHARDDGTKTSAVHFPRFPLTSEMVATLNLETAVDRL